MTAAVADLGHVTKKKYHFGNLPGLLNSKKTFFSLPSLSKHDRSGG
jgi:hypothetical protein